MDFVPLPVAAYLFLRFMAKVEKLKVRQLDLVALRNMA